MTIEQLKQYRSICAEIEEKTMELNEKSVSGTVTGSDSEFPYTKHSIPISGVPTQGNDRLVFRLECLKRDKRVIENFIDGIEDSLTRRIFEYRYLKGKKQPTWQAIAFKIDEHSEQYPRRIHDKFLKNIKLDENDENTVV